VKKEGGWNVHTKLTRKRKESALSLRLNSGPVEPGLSVGRFNGKGEPSESGKGGPEKAFRLCIEGNKEKKKKGGLTILTPQ